MISIAIKYLSARPKQSLLTVLGICFGTTAFIALSGIMLGFREFLIDQLVNNSAHVHVQVGEEFLTDHSLDDSFYQKKYDYIFWSVPPSGRKDNGIILNPQKWYRRLTNDPRVEGFSPQLTASVILSKGNATVTATLIGCDPVQQVKITTIGNYVIEGKWSDLEVGGNRLMLGTELKNRLGVRLSQNILVSLAKSAPIPFKVIGFFQTGNKIADSQAFGKLGDIQKVNQTSNQINEIAIRLKDFSQSANMATAWKNVSPENVESWDQKNASFFTVFKIQDTVRYLTISTILIVAGFGIYNILNMTVMNKRRDIAIMRSMGFSRSDILGLFFFQGLILGVTGACCGLILGKAICLYLATLPFNGPMGGPTHFLISANPTIYMQAGIMGVLSSAFAALLPARTAGKLTPIEIIRAGAE